MSNISKRYGRLLLLVIIVATGIGGAVIVRRSQGGETSSMRIKLLGPPYSLDPIDYDADVHHLTTRPILASLVTQYKAGTFDGVIADQWSSSLDMTTWRFHVRPGLTYSNGDGITAVLVARSLIRMAWLQHARSSQSGLTEQLVGIKNLKTANGHCPGITVDGESVILTFTAPQPKLLETISFGLYGITHPADFDARTGQWHDPRRVTASAAYEVAEWSTNHLTLRLRQAFPAALRHEHAAKHVEFVWTEQPAGSVDITMGNTLSLDGHQDDEFVGSSAVNVYLYYIHLLSWNVPTSPLHEAEMRRALRTQFYKRLEEKGMPISRSFLPTSLPGISQFVEPVKGGCAEHSFTVHVPTPRSQARVYMSMLDATKMAIGDCGGTAQQGPALDIKDITAMMDPNMESYTADLTQRYTGLLVEDPISDVKFMIQSKEGIRLPDPTGRLAAEAAKASPDLAVINRILWDDAIVWPITPFTYGLWARKGMFDFNQLNLGLPPSDLTWIGVRG